MSFPLFQKCKLYEDFSYNPQKMLFKKEIIAEYIGKDYLSDNPNFENYEYEVRQLLLNLNDEIETEILDGDFSKEEFEILLNSFSFLREKILDKIEDEVKITKNKEFLFQYMKKYLLKEISDKNKEISHLLEILSKL